jgi:hypothetical protein
MARHPNGMGDWPPLKGRRITLTQAHGDRLYKASSVIFRKDWWYIRETVDRMDVGLLRAHGHVLPTREWTIEEIDL